MGCTRANEVDNDKNKLINSGFEKALAYIDKKGKKGIGFLCKLPQPDSKSTLPALITTTEIIGKSELEESKQIDFTVEKTKYSIKINEERKTYITEDKYKVVIIEIKIEDGLNIDSFFEIQEKPKIDLDKFIGVISNNEKEKCLEYIICKVKAIQEDGNFIE